MELSSRAYEIQVDGRVMSEHRVRYIAVEIFTLLKGNRAQRKYHCRRCNFEHYDNRRIFLTHFFYRNKKRGITNL